MSNKPLHETAPTEVQEEEIQNRRLFLQSIGKWSGAAITASVVGVGLSVAPEAGAGAWINRRGGWYNRGGGWINRGGGGGSWVNRGGGGWVNRRRGGSWVNRR